MKKTHLAVWAITIVLIILSVNFYLSRKEQEERYAMMTIIPEHSKDIPLYEGLKPSNGPDYEKEGNHWEKILEFYKKELPKNGWKASFVQTSSNSKTDGAGFVSYWRKPGQKWELAIHGGYFKFEDKTQVLFDKQNISIASEWVKEIPAEICINEQPDRSDECFVMDDEQTIRQIIGLINEAPDRKKADKLYNGKSTILAGNLLIEVQYDLDQGIYLKSDKGYKWMKPEKEFFELTRISKEY